METMVKQLRGDSWAWAGISKLTFAAMCLGRDPEIPIFSRRECKKSSCMSGCYYGGKVSWSLWATEQTTLETKLECQSSFKEIQSSLGSGGNKSAAGESYSVVTRWGGQNSFLYTKRMLMNRNRLTQPEGYQPPHSQGRAAWWPAWNSAKHQPQSHGEPYAMGTVSLLLFQDAILGGKRDGINSLNRTWNFKLSVYFQNRNCLNPKKLKNEKVRYHCWNI